MGDVRKRRRTKCPSSNLKLGVWDQLVAYQGAVKLNPQITPAILIKMLETHLNSSSRRHTSNHSKRTKKLPRYIVKPLPTLLPTSVKESSSPPLQPVIKEFVSPSSEYCGPGTERRKGQRVIKRPRKFSPEKFEPQKRLPSLSPDPPPLTFRKKGRPRKNFIIDDDIGTASTPLSSPTVTNTTTTLPQNVLKRRKYKKFHAVNENRRVRGRPRVQKIVHGRQGEDQLYDIKKYIPDKSSNIPPLSSTPSLIPRPGLDTVKVESEDFVDHNYASSLRELKNNFYQKKKKDKFVRVKKEDLNVPPKLPSILRPNRNKTASYSSTTTTNNYDDEEIEVENAVIDPDQVKLESDGQKHMTINETGVTMEGHEGEVQGITVDHSTGSFMIVGAEVDIAEQEAEEAVGEIVCSLLNNENVMMMEDDVSEEVVCQMDDEVESDIDDDNNMEPTMEEEPDYSDYDDVEVVWENVPSPGEEEDEEERKREEEMRIAVEKIMEEKARAEAAEMNPEMKFQPTEVKIEPTEMTVEQTPTSYQKVQRKPPQKRREPRMQPTENLKMKHQQRAKLQQQQRSRPREQLQQRTKQRRQRRSKLPQQQHSQQKQQQHSQQKQQQHSQQKQQQHSQQKQQQHSQQKQQQHSQQKQQQHSLQKQQQQQQRRLGKASKFDANDEDRFVCVLCRDLENTYKTFKNKNTLYNHRSMYHRRFPTADEQQA